MADSIDIDNLLAAIHHRRSFKLAALKPDPVPRDLIERVLEASRWALNHGRTEPWHYTVYTGDSRHALGETFAEAYRMDAERVGNYLQSAWESQRNKVSLAPVWIAIGMKPGMRPDGKSAMPLDEELMAVACSVQLLHLMASALGLAGQWTSNPTATHPHTAQFVGLEPPARLLGFFYLGWPAMPWPEGKRAALGDNVQWAE